MKLSVIIVSWNTQELLAQCLLSLHAHPLSAPHEVIVVDNGSHDGSAQMVSDSFPTVQLIQNQDNRGFSRANNQAIRIARGEYILLLNPDTEVHAHALDRLVDFL